MMSTSQSLGMLQFSSCLTSQVVTEDVFSHGKKISVQHANSNKVIGFSRDEGD